MSRSADGSRLLLGTVAAAATSALLHGALGWAWTVVGGVFGGFVAGRRGVIAGLAGGAVSWAALAAWSWSGNPRAVGEMARVVGSLLGGLPPEAAYGFTVLIGALLGAAGGWAGGAARASRNLAGRVRR